MKLNQITKTILIMALMIATQSCYKTGKIRVKNYSGVAIEDVRWGDKLISEKLLANESSRPIVIEKKDDKLPSEHKISCKVNANGEMIYVETDDSFKLNKGEDKVIQINKYSFLGYLKSHYGNIE